MDESEIYIYIYISLVGYEKTSFRKELLIALKDCNLYLHGWLDFLWPWLFRFLVQDFRKKFSKIQSRLMERSKGQGRHASRGHRSPTNSASNQTFRVNLQKHPGNCVPWQATQPPPRHSLPPFVLQPPPTMMDLCHLSINLILHMLQTDPDQ